MVEAAGPVQEAGLYARVASWQLHLESSWRWWRRLDIVLAVQPEPLDDLDRVLLVFDSRGRTRPQGTQMTLERMCSQLQLTNRTAGRR